MKGNTLMWALMASAPALFLGLIAVVGRTQVSSWEFSEYGKQASDVRAYYGPVNAAHYADRKQETKANALKTANLWIEGKRSGRLKDLLPVTLTDQGGEGTNGRIFEERSHLLARLMGEAVKSKRAGRHEEAAEYAALCVLTSDVNKYSGSYGIYLSSITQSSSLRIIRSSAPYLSEQARKKLLDKLTEVRAPEHPFDQIGQRMAALKIRSDVMAGESTASLRQFQPFSSLAVIDVGSNEQTIRTELGFASYDKELETSVFTAIRAETGFRKALTETRDALVNPPAKPKEEPKIEEPTLRKPSPMIYSPYSPPRMPPEAMAAIRAREAWMRSHPQFGGWPRPPVMGGPPQPAGEQG